jgi:hypothetical protein
VEKEKRMKKTVLIALILISFLFVGCGINHPFNNQTPKTPLEISENVVNSITYVYDARVDICYAIVRSHTSADYNIFSITTVPFEKIKGKVQYAVIGGNK